MSRLQPAPSTSLKRPIVFSIGMYRKPFGFFRYTSSGNFSVSRSSDGFDFAAAGICLLLLALLAVVHVARLDQRQLILVPLVRRVLAVQVVVADLGRALLRAGA